MPMQPIWRLLQRVPGAWDPAALLLTRLVNQAGLEGYCTELHHTWSEDPRHQGHLLGCLNKRQSRVLERQDECEARLVL